MPSLKLISDLMSLSIALFVVLWLRNIVVIIGLSVYSIEFNLDILKNPIISSQTIQEMVKEYSFYSLILVAITLLTFIIGFSPKRFPTVTKELIFNNWSIIVYLLIEIVIIQSAVRLTVPNIS